MRRRTLLRLTAGLAGLPVAPAAASLPNIVLILADDLGYGDLHCYGHPSIRTPNLDRMAAEGMKFLQFYSASPLCTPSRAALMTGRLPIRFGLNTVLSPLSKRGLPLSEPTVAEILKPAGYAAACIGKWHLGRAARFLPTRRGFDRYFGIPYSNDMSRRSNPAHPFYRLRLVPPLPLMRGESVIEEEPDQSLLTARYTAEALTFIRDSHRQGRPFFLFLAHTAPHPPLHPGARFRGHSPLGLYGDAVQELDSSTGQILRALRHLGIDRQTLVMFSSDNGPWLAKHNDGGSPGPLREGKGSTWEGGVRVPFIARWPGRIPAGVTTGAFGALTDVLPTCAGRAGVPLPAGRVYDGADLSGVLFGNATPREPLMFFWVGRQLRALRKGPWKLHLITNEPARGSRRTVRHDPPLLFNLLHDPAEQHNLAPAHPAVVRDLLALIDDHRRTLAPPAG